MKHHETFRFNCPVLDFSTSQLLVCQSKLLSVINYSVRVFWTVRWCRARGSQFCGLRMLTAISGKHIICFHGKKTVGWIEAIVAPALLVGGWNSSSFICSPKEVAGAYRLKVHLPEFLSGIVVQSCITFWLKEIFNVYNEATLHKQTLLHHPHSFLTTLKSWKMEIWDTVL